MILATPPTSAPFVVKSVDQVYFSPVMPLAAEGWAYLEKNGFSDGSPPFSYESAAFYVEDEGQPVGCLIWHVIDWKKEAWIGLGYVKLEYRGRGIYSALYNALIEEAKKRKLRQVSGGISADNDVMLSVAGAQGRKMIAVTCTYKIPQEAEEGEEIAA